jgi:hypothetical protein
MFVEPILDVSVSGDTQLRENFTARTVCQNARCAGLGSYEGAVRQQNYFQRKKQLG